MITLPMTRASLSALAHDVPDGQSLSRNRDPVSVVTFAAPREQTLTPFCWIGDGHAFNFGNRTGSTPAARLYAINAAGATIGTVGFSSDRHWLDLAYGEFAESSRFVEGENRRLIRTWSDDAVTLRMAHELHVDGDCVVLTQNGDHVWGHWLVDVLPRWMMARAVVPQATVAYAGKLANAEALFDALALRPEQLVVYDPQTTRLSADRLIVPSYVRLGNAISQFGGQLLRTLPTPARSRTHRLYLSRARTPRGSFVHNNEQVEAVFRTHGFQILHPEILTVSEQIALFAQASHIAGEYGSAPHGSIFASSETPVLILQGEDMSQFVQAGLCHALGQPFGYVFGTPVAAETHSRWQGANPRRPFEVPIDRLEQGIEALLGH